MTGRSIISAPLAVAVVLLVGCEPQPQPRQDDSEPEPLDVAEIEPMLAVDDDERPEPQPEPVDFQSWPGSHEYDTFDLMWLGGDDELPLRDSPQPDADVIGSVSWLDGEHIDWTTTTLLVETPTIYRADAQFELVGTPYDVEFGELAIEDEEYVVDEGEPVFVYRYGGDGTCYLGVQSEIVYTECPDDNLRQENGEAIEVDGEKRWSPQTRQWWIEVSTDGLRGWFDIDDAPVEVHARDIEGYDEFDGTGSGDPSERYPR